MGIPSRDGQINKPTHGKGPKMESQKHDPETILAKTHIDNAISYRKSVSNKRINPLLSIVIPKHDYKSKRENLNYTQIYFANEKTRYR